MFSSLAYSLVVAALAGTTGPCDLLDRAAAAALLGAPVTKILPSGPEPDEDSGASRTTCTYQAGQAMLLVLRLDFPDAAAARDMTASAMMPDALSEQKGTATPENGLGEQAWIVRAPHAIEYVVLKGPTVLTLALGGTPNPLASYEAQLRASALSAVGKL